MNFLWNLVLAFIWMGLWNSFSFFDFLAGLLISFLLLVALSRVSPVRRSGSYWSQASGFVLLVLFFLRELAKSNVKVASTLLRPRLRLNPGIIEVPMDLKSDSGLMLLSSLITLTPGTLSLDLSKNRKYLYVHTLYFTESERKAFVADIKSGFERYIKKMGFE